MPDTPAPLHAHAPPPHAHENANDLHRKELAKASIIDRGIVWIADNVATVSCIFLFAGIGIGSLVGYFTGNTFLAAVCGALSSYFLQLVLLPLIMYAGKKSDRAREIQSDAIYKFGENTAHDMRESMRHLNAQDVHILKIEQDILTVETTLGEKLDGLTQTVAEIRQLIADKDDAMAAHLAAIHSRLDGDTPPAKPPVKVAARRTPPAKKVSTKA